MAYKRFFNFNQFLSRFTVDSMRHVFVKHMNKTDKDLRLRAKFIPYSSTFICKTYAESDIYMAVMNTIIREHNQPYSYIKDWISDDSDYEDVSCIGDLPEGVRGRGYNATTNEFMELNHFVVVLGKEDETGAFYIVTAYPCPINHVPETRSARERRMKKEKR